LDLPQGFPTKNIYILHIDFQSGGFSFGREQFILDIDFPWVIPHLLWDALV
jgi:hypothetical protein